MNLANGYWQVAMSPEAKRKAAFVTNEGLFQFRVMPFGLCNAPTTFERLMDRVLCGMRWSRCLVYLDDVIFRRPSRDWRKCCPAEGYEMYFYADGSDFSGTYCGSDWAGM